MFSNNQRNIKNYRLSPSLFRLLLIPLLALLTLSLTGQQNTQKPDSIVFADSLRVKADTLFNDSTKLKKAKKPLLEAEIKYSSEDSLIFSIGQQKVFLFDKGVVNYQDIGLTGDYIEFDYDTRIAMAAGAIDSSGHLAGRPQFTQGTEKFDFDTMRYNFQTHKAKIKSIITQQGEGYLHSTVTKRLANGEINIKNGKYTTCDAPEPHFYIALTKAISIPGKRTVAGPGYLVFEDIPMPLGLPFGFFPNTNKRTSGFIIPEFRDEQRRGFGLENGGWYFAFNDYLDVSIAGSIYSRGTWGVKAVSQYLKRYKYNGQFSAQFFMNKINDDPSTTTSKDFKINWSHSQDPKANPTRTFRASVDFATSSFEKQQGTNFSNILENQKNSSIAFTKRWPGRPFNFAANLNASQNTKSKTVSATLPSVNFNMDRIYPFRGKKDDGDYNWLQNIQVSYNSKLVNRMNNIGDSVFFTESTLKKMENGFAHNIPISLENIKILKKLITITPGVNYSGVVFPYYIRKTHVSDTLFYGNRQYITDTIHKITYAHAFSASIGVSASPKLYGMYTNKRANPKVIAVRHVMSPRASFSFTPDMKGLVPNYYRKVPVTSSIGATRTYEEYSMYAGQMNSTPTVNGRSGSLSLGLGNNVEMKVRSKNDSTGKGKKVTILDNLDFATSYRPFSPDYKWAPVTMNARSTLFNKNLQLQLSSTFDPYGLDAKGNRQDVYLINQTGKLFRLTTVQFSTGFRLQSAAGKKKDSNAKTGGQTDIDKGYENTKEMTDMYEEEGGSVRNDYVDFDIPWSVNIDYSFRYDKPGLVARKTSSIRMSGDISITPKWKIGLNSSYDFVAKEFSATNISVYRDLHCWEMKIGVVPFGNYKSYYFTINAKSAILRDLKWDKRKSWRDNF
jgi:hypothetical protein